MASTIDTSGYLIINSSIVFLMTPALGLFYAGLSNSKNALSNILICLLSFAVVTIQWFLFGFSLSFAENGPFIGNFKYSLLLNRYTDLSGSLRYIAENVPIIDYVLYQLQCASITCALIFGSTSQRLKILPSLLFMFLWTTFVYDFVLYWTSASHGWLKNLACLSQTSVGEVPCLNGLLDYAGGSSVHVACGFAGLAFCIFIGKRKSREHKPHNIIYILLGTALLWFGWYGVDGGASLTASARSGMAVFVTKLSSAVGGLTWVLIDYIKTRKISSISFCSGVLAGLVGVTPGTGYIPPWASIVIGFSSAIICYYACKVQHLLNYDDTCDVFGIHGIGGLWGLLMTGIFTETWIGELNNNVVVGGVIEGNWYQLLYQIIGGVTVSVWSFVMTIVILCIMKYLLKIELRLSEDDERLGIDYVELGERSVNES